MDSLIEQVGDAPVSIIILVSWVLALTREKQKLTDKLLECLDDLKRRNIEE